MSLISVSNLEKSFGENTLFSKVTFCVEKHDRIGLVGGNGTGKTTLFKILTGELKSDSGGIAKASDLNIGYLEQHSLKDTYQSVFERTLSVFEKQLQLEKQIEDINERIKREPDDLLIEEQATLIDKFGRLDGLTFRSKTRSALLGLGFSESDLNMPFKNLSGGQRSKVGLARLLLSEPELMLLDEPTNHLDIPSVEWLEEYIDNFKGAVIVISHDRFFLDRVTKRTFEIEDRAFTVYDGNYSRHLEIKKERLEAKLRAFQNTQKEIKRIEGIIEQQRQWSQERNYKTIEHKQKSIDRLEKTLEKPITHHETVKFKFSMVTDSGNDVLYAEDLSKDFDGKILFKDVSLFIKKRQKVFIAGPNGTGKTTLLKSILSDPKVRFGSGVKIGYFDQLQSDLEFSKTVLDDVWDKYPQMDETTIRNALAAFLFKGDEVFAKIGDLSGGERARVSLCKLMLSGANLLILDEPTNHLDLMSREVLENALENFDGTIIAVSHDRYLINRLASAVIWLENGTAERYEGNYDFFLEKHRPSTLQVQSSKKEVGVGGLRYKERKQRESDLRRLKTARGKLEEGISLTEVEIAELEKSLELKENADDYKKAMEITESIFQKNEILDGLLEEWAKTCEKISEMEED